MYTNEVIWLIRKLEFENFDLSGYLYHFTNALIHLNDNNGTATSFQKVNLLKAITKPFTNKIIKVKNIVFKGRLFAII